MQISLTLLRARAPEQFSIGRIPLIDAIRNRRSRRKFKEKPLTLEELSFLLWATQGVQKLIRNGLITLSTVPSGGAMHPFETYLLINSVNSVRHGLYRYLALEHKLLKLSCDDVDLLQKSMKHVTVRTSLAKVQWFSFGV